MFRTSCRKKNPLDIVFNLIGMTSTIDENVLDASVGEEFESIFDQRSVCERKETLSQLV